MLEDDIDCTGWPAAVIFVLIFYTAVDLVARVRHAEGAADFHSIFLLLPLTHTTHNTHTFIFLT